MFGERGLAEPSPGRLGESRRRRHEDHRLDPTRRVRGKVQQGLGTEAHAHRPGSFDVEGIEHRDEIASATD